MPAKNQWLSRARRDRQRRDGGAPVIHHSSWGREVWLCDQPDRALWRDHPL